MLGQELKPCPFCGGKARIGHSPNCNDFWIICRECTTYYPKDMSRKYTESEAIEAWNTRHERTSKRIADEAYRHDDFECSECGWVVWGFLMEHEGEGVVSQPNYCPSCGARVVEE